MWPFGSRKIAPDDLVRLTSVEEKVESLTRRYESLCVDLEEFYAKVNKARQRVVKEDRDAAKATPGVLDMGGSPAAMKSALRQRLRGA